MVLSVLIFTNIIQLVLSILKIISINWLIWIYIFLIIISYVMNTSSIDTIEYLRKESNFIWLLYMINNKKTWKNNKYWKPRFKNIIRFIKCKYKRHIKLWKLF